MKQPGPENDYQKDHADLLRSSYKRWTGKDLIPPDFNSEEGARVLFESSFALLSHNADAEEPMLNYANKAGLYAFQLTWEELQEMPSRMTAEPDVQDERASLMQRVTETGCIDDYSGIRITKAGKRFHIEQATVWNLVDNEGTYHGQAAVFSDWTPLDPKTEDPA